jgi:DNA polymerase III delta prime subunit
VDDMDTINEQSQQVFRNYIDKYKNNINFIAVCSNIQKIIESIQSRVHILHIPPLTEPKIKDIMENIIQCENIRIDEESKTYLLSISNNSIRNVINNLEKIYILGNDINIQLCKKLCSNISFQQFEEFISAFNLYSEATNQERDIPHSERMPGIEINLIDDQHPAQIRDSSIELQNAIKILYKIHDFGYSVIDILDYFFTFVKITKLLSEEQKYKIIPIICKYITIFHNIHEDSIELALFTNDIRSAIINE